MSPSEHNRLITSIVDKIIPPKSAEEALMERMDEVHRQCITLARARFNEKGFLDAKDRAAFVNEIGKNYEERIRTFSNDEVRKLLASHFAVQLSNRF